MIAWRTCKARYDPMDGAGAALHGGRWNSPGRPVIYAADSYAGSLLEILAHSTRPRTLPGAHHAVQIEIPDALVEHLDETTVPSWWQKESAEARQFGDTWIRELRSVALSVPALPARPIGRIIVLNPLHPQAPSVIRGSNFPVPWDDRLL